MTPVGGFKVVEKSKEKPWADVVKEMESMENKYKRLSTTMFTEAQDRIKVSKAFGAFFESDPPQETEKKRKIYDDVLQMFAKALSAALHRYGQ